MNCQSVNRKFFSVLPFFLTLLVCIRVSKEKRGVAASVKVDVKKTLHFPFLFSFSLFFSLSFALSLFLPLSFSPFLSVVPSLSLFFFSLSLSISVLLSLSSFFPPYLQCSSSFEVTIRSLRLSEHYISKTLYLMPFVLFTLLMSSGTLPTHSYFL